MRATVVTISSGFGPVEVRKFVASLAAEIERQLVMAIQDTLVCQRFRRTRRRS